MTARTQESIELGTNIADELDAIREGEPDALEQRAANEIRQLRKDEARLDWLADPSNWIGNVQLPTHCVTANIGNLRDAIDMAMREQENAKLTGRNYDDN